MTHDFWVTIGGARGEEWQAVLGTNRVPVRSPIPVHVELPGIGTARAYFLALDAVQPDDLVKIAEHLSRKFVLAPEEAQREIAAAGIPILADDCHVAVLNPERWFDDLDL